MLPNIIFGLPLIITFLAGMVVGAPHSRGLGAEQANRRPMREFHRPGRRHQGQGEQAMVKHGSQGMPYPETQARSPYDMMSEAKSSYRPQNPAPYYHPGSAGSSNWRKTRPIPARGGDMGDAPFEMSPYMRRAMGAQSMSKMAQAAQPWRSAPSAMAGMNRNRAFSPFKADSEPEY